MDMVPVDFVARAIVNLSMRPESASRVFHLTNPEPIPMNRLIDFMRSFGFAVRRIAYESWKRELLASGDRFERNALYPFGAFIAQYEEGPMSAPRYDCQATIDALRGTSIVCPKMDDDLLSVYFSHFVNTGFVELTQG
jgi:hypothetical protein